MENKVGMIIISIDDLDFLRSLCRQLEGIADGIVQDNGGMHIDFTCLDRYQGIKGVEATLREWIKQQDKESI